MTRRTIPTIIFGVFVATSPLTNAHEAKIPSIDIEFSGLIEFGICERLSGSPVADDAIEELVSRVGEFEAAWNDRGPILLRETVATTGEPFTFLERHAVLHLCPDVPSMSAPLLINSRLYLEATASNVRPLSLFVSILYHEILHNYLVESFGESFDWIGDEFADQPPVVRNHLVLMALEHNVYNRLGLRAELANLREYYLASAPHARALAIVDDKGVEYFMSKILD